MSPRFRWVNFDVNDLLPTGWRQSVRAVAAEADFRHFPRTTVLTREAEDVASIERGRVHADRVQERLPWLNELYHDSFLTLATDAWGQTVTPAKDDRYGVVLNVQRGNTMRFECHVDSNPISGILFCTDHPDGGGELCVARDQGASDMAAIERNCTVIRPHSGHLILFDGRAYPHYARHLKSTSDLRVLAVMNYYTDTYPESTRPQELNRHLYGDHS